MDELVFENDRLDSSPSAQKAKMSQNAAATNAFKEFARSDVSSPNRKHMLNKRIDPKAGKGKASTSPVNELSPQGYTNKNKDLQTAGGARGAGAGMDVKDLGVVGGKKRGTGDQNDSQSAINVGGKEDSFQKLYSKELDLDEDEVPIILHELNDSAIHFISHEQYERSLSLLQKAQTLLDRLKFQKNPKDRFLIQVTMHNMALCFQKMGALEECALCLDACLHQINSQYLAPVFSKKPTKKLKKLKYECKIHMQVCALLSQLHRHEEALLHAKQAVQISQYLLNDLVSLCELNVEKTVQAKKKEQEVHEEQERQKIDHGGHSMSHTSSQADLIYYDHSISMLERTALRVFPIIKEIQNRMVKHKDVSSSGMDAHKNNKVNDLSDNQPLNMKVLLGYLNQSEWLYLLNIGNIMQITPLTIHDLYSNQKIDVELSRDSILEKITFLAISYFCVSTELRFLVSSKEKLSFDPVYVKAESEFWHGKALEISCGFLPSESPLVTHILSSYQKHHAPVQQAIPENEEEDQGLRVIRPEKGIDKSQFQPIIRLNKHLNIALSPLRLSPNNHRLMPKKKIDVKEVSVTANLIVEQPKAQNAKADDTQQLYTEEEALLLQAAALHNPNKRSIEFTNNQSQNNEKKVEVQQPSQQLAHGAPSDMVEFELKSFDQNDIKNQRPHAKQSNRGPQRDEQIQATTPNRQVDQNNKIQMAVPSPNALASAMQREQREQLNHSVQEQTQRNVKNDQGVLPSDKQSASFQVLPQTNNKLLSEAQISSFQANKQRSVEDDLQLAGDIVKEGDSKVDMQFDPQRKSSRQPFKEQQHGSVRTNNKISSRAQNPAQKLKVSEVQEDLAEERTPGVSTQQSARLSGSNNLAQSQRSRSKGKMSKKKGAMTQPQTHQNSANTTAYEPLRQALQSKEISSFNMDRKQGGRIGGGHGSLEGEHEDPKVRQSNPKPSNYKAQPATKGRNTTSSLEDRQLMRPPSTGVNTNASSAKGDGGAVQRPDSRRMIGGRNIKGRQIKDQKQAETTAVRSNSAGRRNQNQTLNMGQYKTNDQSMTSASSQVHFSVGGHQMNQPHVSANNFKTFQQTRKAVTAHSTQASNSPRKGLPTSSKFSENNNTNVARLAKQAHGVQDPVFLNTNQLNQSRSTIEQNNSTMIDRSMNDQLMLNNSSFEVGNQQSRSRSFAKTGGLSQQNSRDVIVGGSKKVKQLGSHPTQQTIPSASKSQNKQKAANKEMLNYLNQGSTGQRSTNALIGSQQAASNSQVHSKYATGTQSQMQHHHNMDVDYRKQMLIKQAMDIQQQTAKEQRQKSGPKVNMQGRTQMAFQTHSTSVQMPMSHSSSVNQQKQQSHSSQGHRKSSHGIAKEQNSGGQSQKVLSNQQQQQIAALDPQALAAISNALNLKHGPANQQQNAQMIYNQILQYQQHQGQQQTQSSGLNSKKQNQNTHNMIKKFLKERATPQTQPPSMGSSQSGALLAQGNQVVQNTSGRQGPQSLSPNPGTQMVQKHSTTLIDNFTQAPFLGISTGMPASKQASTTKASADSKQRNNFNPAKIYSQKQTNQISSSHQQQPKTANSYFTEPSAGGNPLQQSHAQSRKNAAERFDKKHSTGIQEPGQREPTPVFHHKPYQKPEDPMEADNQAQYPMHGQKTANKQLAAMYMSIKGEGKHH